MRSWQRIRYKTLRSCPQNLALTAVKGTTSQAITYPAAGGNSYSSSVQQGTANVGAQINAYYQQCPSTKLVLVGYSQVRRHCARVP